MKAYVIDPVADFMTRQGISKMRAIQESLGVNQFGQYVDRLGVNSRYAMDLMLSNVSVLGGGQAATVDTYSWGTSQIHSLGTIAVDKVGRRYRYAVAGTSALVTGNAIQSSAVLTNHFGLTAAVEAIGAGGAGDVIRVTPGATAGAANLYAEGYLFVNVTPGLGDMYRISGHPEITASVAFNLILDPEETVKVAFTTSTRYGLIANPYKNVIQFPVTTATGSLVGIAVSPIAASNYGWIQTHGLGNALIAGTPALGAMIMSPGTTAGASVIVTTTNLIVAQFVGRMAKVGVDGETNPVALDID